jgi:YHS domain-containing protein
MNRSSRAALVAASLSVVVTCGLCQAVPADDEGPRDIPPAFAPLEYLVGRWKGQGMPKERGANQFRGWTETHSWAWIFSGGKPSGLAVTIEGGKILASGKLSYDAARKRYRLEGSEPKPLKGAIAFEGTLESGKVLVLDQTRGSGESARGSVQIRLSVRPNANFIRYTMTQDRRDPGAFQYSRLIEVGLTKEGESFAGGSAATERPRCIVTGGAATMTLTYQGRTFPICCTGCRDEFNDNPEKYLKKAALMLSSGRGRDRNSQPASSRVNRFEDAFNSDVVDPDASRSASGKEANAKAAATKQVSQEKVPLERRQAKSTKEDARAAATKRAARGATLLRLGRNLEKSGKTSAALSYFRQIVKELPDTPAARTAAERIKALDGK